jgi:hypothetical protein
VRLANNSNHRITQYDCKVWAPAGLLKHWSGTSYSLEVPSTEANRRCFQFTERHFGPLAPGETKQAMSIEYCGACAAKEYGVPGAGGDEVIDARMWIDGREFEAQNTIKGLAIEADKKRA